MPSTFTTNKNIEKPASGSYNNAWAAPVNADWDDIDNALGGHSNISVTGVVAGTYGLSIAQYQPVNIEFSGTISGNLIYVVPIGVGGLWSISNTTTGSFTLSFGVTAGGLINIPQGARTLVVCDGVNVEAAASSDLAAAEAFATAADVVVLASAEAYADAGDASTLASAETFATSAASTAQTNAQNFTTASFAPLASPALTGSPTVNGSAIAVSVSGTFTGTLTGYASNPSGTVNYEIVGKRCTLTCLSAISGTSNATTMTMTGLPAACQPATGTPTLVCIVTANGGFPQLGVANISGSVITFGAALATGGINTPIDMFTGSLGNPGTKGLPAGWTITYVLD
jgi:hypothetical protein